VHFRQKYPWTAKRCAIPEKEFTYKNMPDINRRSGLQPLSSSSLALVPLRCIFPLAFLVASFGGVLGGHIKTSGTDGQEKSLGPSPGIDIARTEFFGAWTWLEAVAGSMVRVCAEDPT
jgi:hypothetical protein